MQTGWLGSKIGGIKTFALVPKLELGNQRKAHVLGCEKMQPRLRGLIEMNRAFGKRMWSFMYNNCYEKIRWFPSWSLGTSAICKDLGLPFVR